MAQHRQGAADAKHPETDIVRDMQGDLVDSDAKHVSMEELYFHLEHLLFQDSPSEGDLQAGQLHAAMQPHPSNVFRSA